MTTRTEYRPALDGLRCMAVIAVILYHLDKRWLPGGFLGVDVFFTLSGYLITSLLLLERQRTGRIDRSRFWSRRAKRLLPAALLVIAAVAVWLLGQPDFVQAARRGDMFSALGNVMNWQLIASGQSYFQAFTTVSPLRHFWSLAIEEQFYLVWPIVCAVLLRSGRLRGLTITCMIGAVTSAGLCVALFSAADPSRSYYGTDTRIHEILIGALLAIWFAHRRNTAKTISGAWVFVPGVLVLVAALVFVHDQWAGYYRGGSVVVALVTALVILAVEAAPTGLAARVAGFGPFAAIGRVSYGLYLWHWPVIVWLTPGTWGIHNEIALAAIRVAVTVVVTAVSYRFVEQPIRNGRKISIRRPRFVAAISFSAIAAVAMLGETVTWGATMPVWASGHTNDRLVGDGRGLHLAVIGDSVATSLIPGLTSEVETRGWSMLNASEPGCPITGLPQKLADGADHPNNAHCAELAPELFGEVVDFHPDVVLWHDLQSSLPLSAEGQLVPAGSDRWATLILGAWQTKLDQLADADVFVVLPPARSQDAPNNCGERCHVIQGEDEQIRALTVTFLARNSRVHELDLDATLCPTGIPCPSKIGNITVRLADSDQTHFTPEGAAWIAPIIMAAITSES
jgi:peptidoglycan/LPS O-acetylase OafA/YrhL